MAKVTASDGVSASSTTSAHQKTALLSITCNYNFKLSPLSVYAFLYALLQPTVPEVLPLLYAMAPICYADSADFFL